MEINLWAVLVCAVVAMVIGSVWFGPLFGKMWMCVEGADLLDVEARKKMQKAAMPLYLVQFILSLLQIYILAGLNNGLGLGQNIHNSFIVWLAFVMPTVAGSAMWNAKPKKVKWAQFLIQAGYQLVLFIIFGWILGVWH